MIKNIWKKSSSKNTADGHKVADQCAAGTYRRNECPASIYLLYHSTSNQVSMFKTDCEHDNHSDNPSRGLSTDMKNFIKEKFDEGFRKPNSILAVMRKKNTYMNEPPKSNLISYLRLLREQVYGCHIF